MGPIPGISPGRSARPSRVASGTVRVTRPANPAAPCAGPGDGGGASGPCRPWSAAVRAAVAAGTGVLAQQQVEEGAGAEHVHVALQPGLLQLLRPGGDPLVGGQDLIRGQLAAHQGGVAGVLGPPFHPGVLGRGLPPFLRLLGGDFHHGCGDGGAQPARGQPGGPVQDLAFGGAGLGVIEQGGGAGDDLGLVPGDRPVQQRGSSAGQPGFEGLGEIDQVLSPAAGLAQRVRDLVGGEFRVLGGGVAAGQRGDGGELAGGRRGPRPGPRRTPPRAARPRTPPANRSSSPAAASAATARSAQPGSTSSGIPGPNDAAGLDDSPGKTRAQQGWPGPRRPVVAASTASSSSAVASRISASSSAVNGSKPPYSSASSSR